MNPILWGLYFGLGLCLAVIILKIVVVLGVSVIALLASWLEEWREERTR